MLGIIAFDRFKEEQIEVQLFASTSEVNQVCRVAFDLVKVRFPRMRNGERLHRMALLGTINDTK